MKSCNACNWKKGWSPWGCPISIPVCNKERCEQMEQPPIGWTTPVAEEMTKAGHNTKAND